MSLAKVTFIKSVKVRRYVLCGCVAACYISSIVACVLCAVQSETLHSTHEVKPLSVYQSTLTYSVLAVLIFPKCPVDNAFATNVSYSVDQLTSIL